MEINVIMVAKRIVIMTLMLLSVCNDDYNVRFVKLMMTTLLMI